MSHMRNIVIPGCYIWLHPLCSQLSISQNIEREGRHLPRETHFLCLAGNLWLWYLEIISSETQHICPLPEHLDIKPMRGLYQGLLTNQRPVFCCLMPPCVSKGLWNDLADYYHQFLAKSRLVFTGPVPTEQSDQSRHKGRVQPWAHKIILNTTPASFSTLG